MSLRDIGDFFARHELTRDDRLGAWMRFASWQFRSRLQKELIVPWIGGQRLLVRRGMAEVTGNIYAGLHEFPEMALVLHLLRPGDLFLDVGANVGSYVVLASGVCHARTIAFEPDPITAAALRRNVSINHLDELVTVNEAAVGNVESMVPFTVGLDTINKVAQPGVTGTRRVRQCRLDDVVSADNPIMVKIDIEGYEEAALDGAHMLLAKPSLKAIEIETVTEKVGTLLQDHGFFQAGYDPWTRRLQPGCEAVRTNNTLYIRDLEFVEGRLKTAPSVAVLGHLI